MDRHQEPRRIGPWFATRPTAALVVAAVLGLGVLGLSLATGSGEEPVPVLFVLPISLVALTRGLRAGLTAGALGVALTAALAFSSAEPDPLAWGALATPMLLMGGLLGHSADRMAAGQRARLRLERAVLRQREAAEINDSIVQGLSAAKWLLESGRSDEGLELLTETIGTAQRLVADLLSDGSSSAAEVRRAQPVPARA